MGRALQLKGAVSQPCHACILHNVRVCCCAVMLARLLRFGPCENTWCNSSPYLHFTELGGHPFHTKTKAAQRILRTSAAIQRDSAQACSAANDWDTITALSSGSGRCGVALLRVSGPRAGGNTDQTNCLTIFSCNDLDECCYAQITFSKVCCHHTELCQRRDRR